MKNKDKENIDDSTFLSRPFWRPFGFIADCFILSILWYVTCIPLFTIGPSTSALNSVCMMNKKKKKVNLIKDFYSSFKSNFKQSTFIWLVYLFFAIDIYIISKYVLSITHVNQLLDKKILLSFFIVTAFVFFFTLIYIFQVISYYELSAGQAFVNSFGISFKYLGKTILMILIFSGCIFVSYVYIFPLLFLPGIIAKISTAMVYPVFNILSPSNQDSEL